MLRESAEQMWPVTPDVTALPNTVELVHQRVQTVPGTVHYSIGPVQEGRLGGSGRNRHDGV